MEPEFSSPTLSGDIADREIFNQLYSFYWKDMYRFAYFYLQSREEAEDAVQEAALQAYRGIGGLKKTEAFKNWIFTILLRKCKRRMRGVIRRRDEAEYGEDDRPVSDESLSDAAALKAEIDRMSDRERQMLWLSAAAGYKSREIAQIMRLPDGTVRSTLSRATAKLRERLDDNT